MLEALLAAALFARIEPAPDIEAYIGESADKLPRRSEGTHGRKDALRLCAKNALDARVNRGARDALVSGRPIASSEPRLEV
jgi:hypothetical protein